MKRVTPFLALFITGCASLSPQDQALLAHLQADSARRVDAFNLTAHIPLPRPRIALGTCNLEKDEVCYGDRRGDTITIDPTLCRADLEDCFNDTLPHESSHWAIAYYYLEPTPLGVPRKDVHSVLWANLMRSFGGDPCKHYKEFCR